jgi:hypothetical protein
LRESGAYTAEKSKSPPGPACLAGSDGFYVHAKASEFAGDHFLLMK